MKLGVTRATWRKRIDEEDIEEKEKELRKKKIKARKYVGETARSAYEHGMEHQEAYAVLPKYFFY